MAKTHDPCGPRYRIQIVMDANRNRIHRPFQVFQAMTEFQLEKYLAVVRVI